MKYIVCTQQEPLAIYSQDTLRDLGQHSVDQMKLLERADVMHFLSYVAPCLGRCDRMGREALHNLLLVSGFQHGDTKGANATHAGGQAESSFDCMVPVENQSYQATAGPSVITIQGLLPSKVFPSLPVEIKLVGNNGGPLGVVYYIDSLRFQIIDAHRSI